MPDRIFRLLLYFYSRAFRLKHGSELMEFFQEERHHPKFAGRVFGPLHFWIRTITDLLRTAIRMRTSLDRGPDQSQMGHTPWTRLMETVWQDVRYSLRGCLKRPGFAAVVVATLALGIGANSAIFSVINGVVLRPLPYNDPEGVVFVWEQNYQRDVRTNVVSPANYLAWKDQNDVFSNIGAIAQISATITGDRDPERVGVVQLSADIFTMLGVRAHLGRLFIGDDESPEAPSVVVLGFGLWQRRFGSDPSVVGNTVTLNGSTYDVVGILPPTFGIDLPITFNSTGSQDVWAPMRFDEAAATARGRWLQVLARLKPGVPIERAQSQMATLAQRLEQQYPDAQAGWTTTIVPLHTQLVGDVRTPLLILLGSVGFVLLIACVNVANLMLANATGRQREIALRSALGAGRKRMVRQLLTESLVFSLAGGAAGMLVAYIALQALLGLSPTNLPRLTEIGIDYTVVGFTVLLSLATGLLFGSIPAIRVSGMDVKEGLTESGERGGIGLRHNRTRSGLVVVEFALSLILLVGAGLLIRSFAELLDVDMGFDTSGVITAQVYLPNGAYPTSSERARVFESLVDRTQSLAGVSSASAITFMPLAGAGSATSFWANDRSIPGDGEKPVADIRWVHRDFHAALGVPLISGRTFGPQDTEDAPLGVLINEWAAREFWPGEDAIGKTISMPWGDTLVARVIGVVGDVLHDGPFTVSRTKLYWDHRQFNVFNQMTLFARSDGDPTILAGSLRDVVSAVDPNLPLYNVRTTGSYYGETLGQAKFSMLALGISALVALMLASIGVYGVMSYSVNERTREIGIRIALGAESQSVTGQVLWKGAKLLGIAVALGIGGSIALSRLMEGLVFEVPTTDPITIVAVTLLLTTVALAACYLPARRASRIDPMRALRQD